MKRIALTGGPGAGKTVVAGALVRRHPHRFALVPEAATQIYDRLQTRWDKLDVPGRRDVQRMIYALQIEQESRVERMFPEKILLLDRGTIDGAAYWPDGPDAYWVDLNTTLGEELNRYQAVIFLETAASLGIYDGNESNACRFEDREGAIRSGQILMQLWEKHSRIIHVPASREIVEKVDAVERTIEELRRGAPR